MDRQKFLKSADTLFAEMNACNESGKHRAAIIIFSQSNWDSFHSELSRSYTSGSNQSGWDAERMGRCRIGSCLDGLDEGVRLDWYNWEVEAWYWADDVDKAWHYLCDYFTYEHTSVRLDEALHEYIGEEQLEWQGDKENPHPDARELYYGLTPSQRLYFADNFGKYEQNLCNKKLAGGTNQEKINSILEELDKVLDGLEDFAKKHNELYSLEAVSYLNDVYRDIEDMRDNIK